MGCSNSKRNVVVGPENFDERWNNKTGLCLALRFEAGEEKSLGIKCGIEKKGYHTKRGRKRETPIPEDVAKDSVLKEEPMTDEGEDEGIKKKPRDRITKGGRFIPLRSEVREEPKEP